MTSYRRTSFLSTTVLVIALYPVTLHAGLKLLYPPDKAIINQPEVRLIGTCDDSDIIIVRVKRGTSLSGDIIQVQNGYFVIPILLKKGVTSVKLKSSNDEELSLQLGYGERIDGFTKWKIHTNNDFFNDCNNCHASKDKSLNYKRVFQGEESCGASSCHGEMDTKKYVHGPVAGGECFICHNPHGSPFKSSTFASGSSLCFECHDDKQDEMMLPFQHAPAADGDCIGCHDPHQSDYRYQLHEKNGELCFMCHDSDEKTGGKYTHMPVEDGDCTECHSPHASKYSSQLKRSGNQVCFYCHTDKEEDLAKSNVHPPAEDDCLNCHNPHTENHEFMLASNPPELCWNCHSDKEEEISSMPVQHMPVEDGMCTECHQVHGTDNASLLQVQMPELCSECHSDLGDKIASATNVHEPVADGDCTQCHLPHGSEFERLLVTSFTTSFYNKFEQDLYSLCFDCHDPDLVLKPSTDSATEFRNGEQNLHFVHVNREKGRNCLACHDIHAALQDKQIRHSVPFGRTYKYPIVFTKTDDGGQCQTGCHKPRRYSR